MDEPLRRVDTSRIGSASNIVSGDARTAESKCYAEDLDLDPRNKSLTEMTSLSDAIAEALHDWSPAAPPWPRLQKHLERAVVAWLSVVSEDEIEAAARAMYDASWRPGASHALSWDDASDEYRTDARAALAASRGVLLPKET